MDKTLVYYCLILFLFYGTQTGCQMVTCGSTKESFLENYERFIEKLDDEDLSAGASEWKKYDEQFRVYIEDCYDQFEADLTGREKRLFWLKTLKYYSIRYGEGMLNELSREDAITEKIEKNLEETLEKSGQQLEDLLEENKEEINRLLEEMGKDVEGWVEKFKEILEK